MTQFALLGSAALWLMYVWLLAAIVASYLSERKGYGEKLGLAFGLLLSLVGTIIWLVWPPRPDSKWKKIGPWGRGKDTEERLAAVEAAVHHDGAWLVDRVGPVEDHRPFAGQERVARAARVVAGPAARGARRRRRS